MREPWGGVWEILGRGRGSRVFYRKPVPLRYPATQRPPPPKLVAQIRAEAGGRGLDESI
jgi:hypothetical protein